MLSKLVPAFVKVRFDSFIIAKLEAFLMKIHFYIQ